MEANENKEQNVKSHERKIWNHEFWSTSVKFF